MAKIKITLNDREVLAAPGVTILEAAREVGIDIPTLCHHQALSPIGACRICVVEIEGQKNLQAACAFPIYEGIVVKTESPRVVAARKVILDMLFAERNHYCPFCEMSGDCELQNLGYRYGINHWEFSTYRHPFPLDATRKYFIMEQNRCVLCQRCVRACSELVANHTLGLRQRGAQSMVHADANMPFVDSTCISCGTCMQVCPTGAIVDRRSSFMGRGDQIEHTRSICNKCSIGCGTNIVTRGGNVIRIEGDWDAPVNGGLLCKKGRFEPLYDERNRLTQPLLRRKEGLVPVSWDEALTTISGQLAKIDAKEMGLLVSGDATNEALYLASRLFGDELQCRNMALLCGAAPDLGDVKPGNFSDLSGSDLILVVGANPVQDQPVASFLIKRFVDEGKRLIVIDDGDNGLVPFAEADMKLKDIGKAVKIADKLNQVTVLYGTGLNEKAADALKKLSAKARFIPLEPGVNTHAAVTYGIKDGFKASGTRLLYILQGEQDVDSTDIIMKKAGKNPFIVVQASYMSSLTDQADVVLPMAIWSERSGSLTNTEGHVQTADQAVEPLGEARADWKILVMLADKLGKNIGTSFKEISKRAVKQLT
ncbi:MAG: molybdopterin-dependent oxidoreductase [Syntrophaceae bacterium]|nr:molybdopterin-dependent oxidoreductase [Syntrophaceae bacterium]